MNFLLILSPHRQPHSAKIRDEPNQPDKQAVAVELFMNVFTAFSDHIRCPDDIGKHQPESNLSGEGIRIEDAERFGRN